MSNDSPTYDEMISTVRSLMTKLKAAEGDWDDEPYYETKAYRWFVELVGNVDNIEHLKDVAKILMSQDPDLEIPIKECGNCEYWEPWTICDWAPGELRKGNCKIQLKDGGYSSKWREDDQCWVNKEHPFSPAFKLKEQK